MKKYALFFVSLFTVSLFAAPIPAGDWYQTSSTAGDAADIVMTVVQVTPHIVQLDSNNGWVGYAWYDEAMDEYRGFFELLKDTETGRGWTNKVFTITMVRDRMTLFLEGKNREKGEFTATFRLKN